MLYDTFEELYKTHYKKLVDVDPNIQKNIIQI
jgi:hypothetical protein